MPEPGPVRLRTNVQPDLPPISLDHLAAMSDDTGIFQHAVHAIADRSHGYCIDDNARALLLCCGLAGGPAAPLARRLSSTFAAFIQHEIGGAHVCTPVTNAQLVCRLTLDTQNTLHDTPTQ